MGFGPQRDASRLGASTDQGEALPRFGKAQLDDHRQGIAAVVVLYRPEASVFDNLASYADQVAHVFAVDNTESPEADVEAMLVALPNTTYIANRANLGLAAALNTGARAALALGYTRILTMDQDSTATPGMVEALAVCMDTDDRIALVTPVHEQVGGLPRLVEPGYRDLLTTMTSGNLVRGEAYASVGGFMEGLFIDQVDNEFCLKLNRAGFRVVLTADAVLHHRVGALRRHRFPYPGFSTNHSAVRRYYIARNRLVVGNLYRQDFPQFRAFELAQMLKEMVKILFYEDQKLLKFRMILRGVLDYRRGVLGPYPGP